MTIFNTVAKNKVNTEILQKVRAEQKSVYALEHMLGYHLNELEELRPHKDDIEFIAKSDYSENPDLVDLSYWSERIGNIEVSIKKNEKMITRLYDRLYSQIIFKMIEGEELSQLDVFFYKSKKYIQKIRNGEMTFQKLVEHYNWELQKFEDEGKD
jgi:hypothetical protein